MAVDDPWAIDGLALSALEWRRATSGLLVHGGNDVSAVAGVLSGCAVSVVTLTATVAAGQLVITPQAGTNGSYLVGMTSTTIAITARDATYARIDRVIARIYDNSIDGSGQNKAAVEIVTGTPSASPAAPTLPTGALELAQLQVPNSAGGSIVVVDKRNRIAAAGGSPWFPDTTARDAALTTPSAGQLCTTGTAGAMVVWSYTGAAWVQVAPVTIPGVVLSSPLPNPNTLTSTQKLVGTTGTAVGYPVDSITAMIEVNAASGHDHCFQTVRDGASPFRSWTRRGLYSGGSWTFSPWRCLDPEPGTKYSSTTTTPAGNVTYQLLATGQVEVHFESTAAVAGTTAVQPCVLPVGYRPGGMTALAAGTLASTRPGAATVAADGTLTVYNWNSSAAIVYCHGIYTPAG